MSDRIENYISKVPPSVAGDNGHAQTFKVAQALINGFCLSTNEALPYLQQYNLTCDPPWSDKELLHKLQDAERIPKEGKPKGWLLSDSRPASNHHHQSPRPIMTQTTATPKKPKPRALPETGISENEGLMWVLHNLFKEDECIRVVFASEENGEEKISGDGNITLERDKWIEKFYGTTPNDMFDREGSPGIFVGINPMKKGSKGRDADVTSYRHALIEFDQLSKEEQWAIIKESNVPCSAVIDSGGKSIHAWVRVDASSKEEYNARVQKLMGYFEPFGCDPKNKNPGRLSRLPGARRGSGWQRLIEMDIGDRSWVEWEFMKGTKIFSIKKLRQFNVEDDPTCLLGNRWLCEGGGAMIVGQSGVGKSSLCMQAAISWVQGKDFMEIHPKRKLRILLVQAENDEGDMAEETQGSLAGMGILPNSPEEDEIDERLMIIRDVENTSQEFIQQMEGYIEVHKPDLVLVDPLNSYFGEDLKQQCEIARFFRQGVNKLADKTRTGWIFFHHTNKPPSDKDARKGWNAIDYAYLGSGGADLVNWARAVMVVLQDGEKFRFMGAKRGKRLGWETDGGKRVNMRVISHSSGDVIYWNDEGAVDPYVEPENKPEKGQSEKSKKAKGRPALDIDIDALRAACGGKHLKHGEFLKILMEEEKLSRSTAKRRIEEVLPHYGLARNPTTHLYHFGQTKEELEDDEF